MQVDFSEDVITSALLSILLLDRTTNKNIIWATDDYLDFGEDYDKKKEINIGLVMNCGLSLVQPRFFKSSFNKKRRLRDKAEIFTPSWICNEQNNLIDEAWFGKADVFNKIVDEQSRTWQRTSEKIFFEGNRTWKSYIEANRLEITCGEAPYLVSRYDAVTGVQIPLENRIGLLDRKFRIVFENTSSESEWLEWAKKSIQSVYGYEFQGDNLLLARKNILCTYIENYKKRFEKNPSKELLAEIAEIISWNLWQMDGLTNTIPFIAQKEKDLYFQSGLNFFDDVEQPKENIYCKIKDWKKNEILEYRNLTKGA